MRSKATGRQGRKKKSQRITLTLNINTGELGGQNGYCVRSHQQLWAQVRALSPSQIGGSRLSLSPDGLCTVQAETRWTGCVSGAERGRQEVWKSGSPGVLGGHRSEAEGCPATRSRAGDGGTGREGRPDEGFPESTPDQGQQNRTTGTGPSRAGYLLGRETGPRKPARHCFGPVNAS